MRLIRAWLTPPVFEDDAKTELAFLLHVIVWLLICVPAPYLLYSWIFTPESLPRALLQTAFGETVNVILLILVHYGFVRSAAILQVGAFWSFFTVTAMTGSGVQSEAYLLGYSIVIMIAGLLLGINGALAVTGLSLLAGGLMVSATQTSLGTQGFESTPLTTWIISVLLFPVSAALQYLGTRVVQNSLARARASEERYRIISQLSSDYTFATDIAPDGTAQLNWVAGAIEKISGYTPEEYAAIGGWSALLHPEDVAQDQAALETLKRRQPVVHEIRTYTKQKEIQWVRVYAHPVWDEKRNQLSGVVGAVQDITEQKQAIEALRYSESIYRRAIEVAGAVPYHQTFDAAGNISYDFIGEGIRQITGYGPDEFTDDLWGLLVQERNLLEALEPFELDEAIQQVRTGKIPIWKCEHCIKARDGKIRWVFEAAVDLRDEHGTAYGSVGLYQDVTERKQAETALKYERDLLQFFLDNIPDTVYFKDAESRFVRINNAQARFLGVASAQEAIGKTDHDFQPRELAQQALDEEKRILATGQPIVNRIEFNPTREGHPRWLSATKVPVKDSAGHLIGTIGISRDITSQKLIEERELKRRAMLEKIVKLGQYVTEVKDLPTALQRIWYSVRHDLDFDRLGIYLYDSEHNFVHGTYGTNHAGDMVDERHYHFDLNDPTLETISFTETLKEPNGLYLTGNYEVEHGISGEHIMTGVKGYAAVAAWAGEKPIAVLCVDNVTTQRPISEEHLEALRLFAGYAGLAIENARLSDALQSELSQEKQVEERESQRRVILEKVMVLGQQVTEVNTLRTTLERIWHGVHDTLEFDRLAIFLYNAANNSLDATLGTTNAGEIVEEWGQSFSITEVEIFRPILEKPEAVYFTHNYDIENDIEPDNEMYGVKDYVAVAAWAGGRPVAVICGDRLITGLPISAEQVEALRLFAGYAGLAIENARLHAALQTELTQQKAAEEREVRQRETLEKVVKLGKLVTEVTELKTAVERIWHGIHHDLGFDRLAIFLYDQEHHSVTGTVGTSNTGEMVPEWGYSRSLYQSKPTSFTRALEQPNGVFFTDHFSDEFKIPPGHDMYQVTEFAAVTAWGGNKPVAIITVDNFPSQRSITQEALEALRLFAGYAGLAIENARLKTALEDDLSHRKTLIDELEKKNAELERFTYTVSHDLKSPLVTITGFLGFLEQDAASGNTEKVRGNIKRINNAAHKMQALLNDLLELSRIGRLINPPEEIRFEEIVHEAVDRVRGRLDEINAIVEIQTHMPIIRGDRVRLVEVVQNLIENAAKYSNPAAHTRIEIGCQPDPHGAPVFFVRDNGIGIAPKYHERIFGLFNQLNAQAEGTGIGLTLVKRIIEVHNGQIWVESEAGKGATFFFTLPAAKSKE